MKPTKRSVVHQEIDAPLLEVTGTVPTTIFFVCITLVVLLAMGAAFHECHQRSREQHELRRIYVERCEKTPAQAEEAFPYSGGTK